MLILLDRDGVINQDMPRGVHNIDMFTLLPKAVDAIAALCSAGHTVCIVTNQSSVGRGWMTRETLDEIHQILCERVAEAGGKIADIFVADEAPDTPSMRRKPAPGMMYEAMQKFHATPNETVVIGDALRDLMAANAAGCHAILVRTGKGTLTESDDAAVGLHPIAICDDLWHATQHLLAHHHQSF